MQIGGTKRLSFVNALQNKAASYLVFAEGCAHVGVAYDGARFALSPSAEGICASRLFSTPPFFPPHRAAGLAWATVHRASVSDALKHVHKFSTYGTCDAKLLYRIKAICQNQATWACDAKGGIPRSNQVCHSVSERQERHAIWGNEQTRHWGNMRMPLAFGR